MFRNEKLELKVGLFIGVGIFLGFFIIFSVSDIYLLQKGYNIKAVFDFVNGIKENAPIRLAGVHVGEVKKIDIFYDDDLEKTRVTLGLWVTGETKIEKDSVARINTLGLLGEQYLEITPGTSNHFLKAGNTIVGKSPVNVGLQMERMVELVDSAAIIFQNVAEGKGTLGKFLVDDTIYNDLETIFGRLSRGEGTIGKLLVEERVYDNIEEFTSDIKAHPWKLLRKTSDRKKRSESDVKKRGTGVSTR
ncbi:MAG: MlaD family protein [Candidatus Omnitrophota bacterium]|nr:MlaD family protein [Candidatus Omnitrophota bacterium]